MKFSAWLTGLSLLPAASLALPTPPKVNDPALKIELVATIPEVEACTTVVGAPDGAVYVGNDPRDGRLNTREPVCWITRFSSVGSDRKRTVFADKLYSPAGSAWHDDWLYVIHDPFMSRFKDRDGDGVAEVREDLITNLGLVPYEGLNDHCVSGFTLGMDGFFYISVGDRGIYQAKSTKDGSTLTMQGGGMVRCRPDGSQLEIFSTGTRNHLQVNLDAEDNAFTRDNTDDGNGWWTRLTHHIEGGYYGYPYDYQSAPNFGVTQPSPQTLEAIARNRPVVASEDSSTTVIDRRYSAERFLPAMTDFGGGSPTGGLCYLSDGLPEQYREKHFFSEWGKAGLFVTEVARDGATFRLVKDTKLVEPGKGGEFRPMQISVANDGSVLIADWGYGGWKSPRVAGAVWRLFWPDAKPAPRLKEESKATVVELIAALGHPDRGQRLRAQGVLGDKGEGVVERLESVANDERASVVQRTHSLWVLEHVALTTYTRAFEKERDFERRIKALLAAPHDPKATPYLKEVLQRISGPLATLTDREFIVEGLRGWFPDLGKIPEAEECTLLCKRYRRILDVLSAITSSTSPSIRAQATRAIGSSWTGNAHLTPWHKAVDKRLEDSSPEVRLQAVNAMGRTSGELVSSSALSYLLKDSSPWIRFATINALRKHQVWAENQTWPNGSALEGTGELYLEGVWRTLTGIYDERLVGIFTNVLAKRMQADRTRATTALGLIAYQSKPYDGHWWATQPVKSPPLPHNVAWSGTSEAVEALTTALFDSDTRVRLAAAKAFSNFILGRQRSVVAKPSTPPSLPVPSIDDAMPSKALAALRARLTSETDVRVRRELIESLGVQKDPQAMDTFTQITLDRTTNVDSRKAALEAIIKLGGNRAQKTVAELASTDLPNEIALDVIRAVGQLKVVEAAELLKTRLHATDPAFRITCIKSLGALGTKANATAALIETLSDKDRNVQQAAIEALGVIRDKAALPALIALFDKNNLKKETLKAISNMPDESAIPVLIGAIADKDTSIRRDALKALKSMREKSWPLVEERLAIGLVPPEFETEIRNTFQSGAITKWKVIGPFENVWDAVHPPEADAADPLNPTVRQPPDRRYSALLAKTYQSAEGKAVAWREVSADADTGRVNLEHVFKTNAMVCAYAYAEIDAPEEVDAKILAGSNDQIAIWLNGNKIYNVAAKREFQADKDDVPAHLVPGKNHLFVKIGNVEGGWEFAVRMPGYENGKFVRSKEMGPEQKQRAFALAKKPDGSWLNPGNARRGEKIFHDKDGPLAAICATCHAVGALGGQIGSNLSVIGTIYNRADLITSIIEPSKTIALGFDAVFLETKAGETIAGVLRNESADAVTIIGADGQMRTVPKTEVKMLTRLPTSFMPPGLTLGLKPEQFTDLLAYLETLGR